MARLGHSKSCETGIPGKKNVNFRECWLKIESMETGVPANKHKPQEYNNYSLGI